MHAWEQIQRTIEYIEEHLSEDISIDSLAEIAALSPFYYQRLFTLTVKKPVAEYIKLRRMAIATETLLHSDKRILDIALDLGFSSHEQFSRTFKETFKITPDNYRRNPIRFNKMTKPQLSLNYTIVDEDAPLITDGVVLEISRKKIETPEYFVGLVTTVPISSLAGLGIESGVDPLDAIWKTFHESKASIASLLPNGVEIDVTSHSTEDGYFNYFVGGQANSETLVEGYENWTLPPGEYVVCTFEAEDFESLVMDAIYKANKYLFDVWLPSHKLEVQEFSVSHYATHDPATSTMEIWVLPVV